MTSDHGVWLRMLLERLFVETLEEGGGWGHLLETLMIVAELPAERRAQMLEHLQQNAPATEEHHRLKYLQQQVDVARELLKRPKVH